MVDVSRRGFLGRLGLGAAAAVTNGVPTLPGSPVAPAGSGPLDEIAKQAAKNVFQKLAQSLQAAGRALAGSGREFAEGREDIKKMFDASDTVRDLLTGKASVKDVTFDPQWIDQLKWGGLEDTLQNLPQELTIKDLIGPEIEDSFRQILGEEGLKNLPSKEVRQHIAEVLEKIGGDAEKTIESVRTSIWGRTQEIAEDVYERMKSDPSWTPENDRQKTLRSLLEVIDSDTELSRTISDEYETIARQDNERWGKDYEAMQEAEAERKRGEPGTRDKLYVRVIDHSKDPSENLSIGPRTFSLVVNNSEDYQGRAFRLTPIHVLHFLQNVVGPEIPPNVIERTSIREFPGGVQFSLKDDASAHELRAKLAEHIAKEEGDSFELPDRTMRPVVGEKMK